MTSTREQDPEPQQATGQALPCADNSYLCTQLFVCVGILIAYIAGLPYEGSTPPKLHVASYSFAWWRVMFIICLVPALLQVCSLANTDNDLSAVTWKSPSLQ